MSNDKWLLFFIIILMSSCFKDEDVQLPTNPVISKISVINTSFVNAVGHDFFPWGLNYTTNETEGVGLMDDNWYDDNIWQIIQSDFLEMKELGANVVRIHLQYNKFMLDVNTPNELALNRLEELVIFAENNDLYLDVTGLGAYRSADQPMFYDDLSDEERWNTQAIFWGSIAEKIGGNAAVFAFNLMNEPVVSVGCDSTVTCDWLPGESFGGFHFVQNITRTAGNLYTPTLKNWIATMSNAIRNYDSQTPITVGFLNLGSYNQFASDLDYLSPHIYPVSGDLSASIDQVISNQSDVPAVIEEIYNLHCSAVELETFVEGIEGQYNGLMGHYFGIPLNALDETDIIQAIQRNFLQFFIDNNPN